MKHSSTRSRKSDYNDQTRPPNRGLIASFGSGSFNDRLRIVLLVIFLAVCTVFGGASRADEAVQIPVRLAAIVVLVCSTLWLRPKDIIAFRVPFALLGLLALLMILQLIPMPPQIFGLLPGRGLYQEVARAAGAADTWRPLTLTPDLTLNSLLALLPGAAMLTLVAGLNRYERGALVPIFLVIFFASLLFGLFQLSRGDSAPYIHVITNPGFPVGFFANRNHEALAAAICLPMLAAWAGEGGRGSASSWIRIGLAIFGGLLILPFLLVAGSRSAFLIGAAVTLPVYGYFLWPAWRDIVASGKARAKWYRNLGILIAVAVTTVIGLTLGMSKATSVDRLFSVNYFVDQRYVNVPALLRMITDSFPIGFGFGSFEPVFRAYEPEQVLSTLYFNHAHNDFIELVIEAGLPGILLLIVLIVWLIMNGAKAWFACPLRKTDLASYRLAQVATIPLLMILIASVVDYPVRTPIFSVFCVAMIALLITPGQHHLTSERGHSTPHP